MKHKILLALGALEDNKRKLKTCGEEIKYSIERIDYAIDLIKEEIA